MSMITLQFTADNTFVFEKDTEKEPWFGTPDIFKNHTHRPDEEIAKMKFADGAYPQSIVEVTYKNQPDEQISN